MYSASLRASRRAVLAGGAALAVGGALWAAGRRADPRVHAFSGETMGTSFHVRFASARPDPALHAAARAAAGAALAEVDARMSTFRMGSELSRLNRHAVGRPFELSAPLLQVLSSAQDISGLSGGAFDVTAGRFVNAWGFGPDAGYEIVRPEVLARLQRSVGFRKLELDARERRVVRSEPGLYADLSGIAKGYGVDRAAQALEALGIGDYVVEAGGEVRAAGRRPDGGAWLVGIEEPQPALPRRARLVLPLADAALATSGDYRIFFQRGGRRYCHEIDPASGCPVDNRVASVSVVAADCMRADALATALMVLGPERGPALAERLGLPAHFVVHAAGGGLRDHFTPAFAALGARAPQAA